MMKRSSLAGLIPILLLFAACDDDPAKPGGGGPIVGTSVSGHLTVVYDSVAVQGARVALVDPFPYRVVDGPVTTDASGLFRFDNPPAGDWYLFVFADSVFFFDAADARVSVRTGTQVTRDIEMTRSELWGLNSRRISGRVTDAETGEPIEGAFVSGLFAVVWHSFAGYTLDVETMTDSQGDYSVTPVSMFVGSFPLLHPLGVTADGYAPFYMTDVPVPDNPDSVYVLDVALERIGTGGRVEGRIVDAAGEPVPNLPVVLDYTGIPLDSLIDNASDGGLDDPAEVPVLGSARRTDAQGRFEILDLAPGTYFIDPGFLPNDGYVGGYDESGSFEITGDEVVDVGDVYVLPAIVPVSPASGQIVHNPRPVLRWNPVPGADWYRLSTGSGHLLESTRRITGQTEYAFEFDLPVGTHLRWSVTAYRTADPYDEVIAEFEAVQSFIVAE